MIQKYLGNDFFGQSWVKWAAFIVLLLAISYLWSKTIR